MDAALLIASFVANSVVIAIALYILIVERVGRLRALRRSPLGVVIERNRREGI